MYMWCVPLVAVLVQLAAPALAGALGADPPRPTVPPAYSWTIQFTEPPAKTATLVNVSYCADCHDSSTSIYRDPAHPEVVLRTELLVGAPKTTVATVDARTGACTYSCLKGVECGTGRACSIVPARILEGVKFAKYNGTCGPNTSLWTFHASWTWAGCFAGNTPLWILSGSTNFSVLSFDPSAPPPPVFPDGCMCNKERARVKPPRPTVPTAYTWTLLVAQAHQPSSMLTISYCEECNGSTTFVTKDPAHPHVVLETELLVTEPQTTDAYVDPHTSACVYGCLRGHECGGRQRRPRALRAPSESACGVSYANILAMVNQAAFNGTCGPDASLWVFHSDTGDFTWHGCFAGDTPEWIFVAAEDEGSTTRTNYTVLSYDPTRPPPVVFPANCRCNSATELGKNYLINY